MKIKNTTEFVKFDILGLADIKNIVRKSKIIKKVLKQTNCN